MQMKPDSAVSRTLKFINQHSTTPPKATLCGPALMVEAAACQARADAQELTSESAYISAI